MLTTVLDAENTEIIKIQTLPSRNAQLMGKKLENHRL